MATYSKQLLSQSINGKAINVTATGINVTLLHTTLASSGAIDEIWLYASNSTSSDILLNILYGGTGFVNDVMFEGVVEAYAGNTLICPGLILKGDGATGLSIYGNSTSASGINIFGYINRIN